MPVFIAKYNEQKDNEGEFGLEAADLIGTIKVPKNLALLRNKLPPSQYDEDVATKALLPPSATKQSSATKKQS